MTSLDYGILLGVEIYPLDVEPFHEMYLMLENISHSFRSVNIACIRTVFTVSLVRPVCNVLFTHVALCRSTVVVVHRIMYYFHSGVSVSVVAPSDALHAGCSTSSTPCR